MGKMRRIGSAMVATAAVAVATTAVSGAAHAATSAPHDTAGATVESQVAGLLKYNKGAKRIAADKVDLGQGAVVTVHPDSAVSPAVSVSLCSFRHGDAVGWLCLYQNDNWGGENLDLTVCTNVNLSTKYMSNGRPWNDQISSIDNDQTSNVTSVFYNYDGSGDPNSSSNWQVLLRLPAGHYLRDLSKDKSLSNPPGGYANDKIDIVHVC
ncbi:hypothetical protein Airi01_010070 [Actinoallomurus iriomotensis]|uniref:Secreted protein n=2 Tax=Actinoallomurus iriomotensis TaxID=478107 RepID=A0A9W6VLJ7_9ACTN|nr:hypothetical protein Airi01_010070 [Actinoallomurus iriomotensis]